MAQTQHRDPMKTKSGKTRLGPLNLDQLKDMLEKAVRPRDRARLRNRIRIVEARQAKHTK